jgi:hypothetical protein
MQLAKHPKTLFNLSEICSVCGVHLTWVPLVHFLVSHTDRSQIFAVKKRPNLPSIPSHPRACYAVLLQWLCNVVSRVVAQELAIETVLQWHLDTELPKRCHREPVTRMVLGTVLGRTTGTRDLNVSKSIDEYENILLSFDLVKVLDNTKLGQCLCHHQKHCYCLLFFSPMARAEGGSTSIQKLFSL